MDNTLGKTHETFYTAFSMFKHTLTIRVNSIYKVKN